MSLANKLIRPLPNGSETGRYASVEKLYGGIKRITRRYEVTGGSKQFAKNVESQVFDTYGLLDGESDSEWSKEVSEDLKFADCYLEEQRIESQDRESNSCILVQVYQEAYDTVREIARPVFGLNEDGRNTIRRTFVILNTAPEGNKKPAIGTPDTEKSGFGLSENEIEEGNAVSVITRTYIEAGATLAQVGGDEWGRGTNGLLFLNQNFIGLSNAPIGAETIGTSSVGFKGTTLKLGQIRSTKSAGFKRVEKRWLEPGILSQSEDFVGSQLAIQVQAFAIEPETPSGYVLARKQESDVEGIKTHNFTFLKENVILSKSEDKVGSQQAETIQVFKPSEAPTPDNGGTLAREQTSDFEGIPTVSYTFLKPSVLSRSEDFVGSQRAIQIQAFELVPDAPGGYLLARKQESDFEGIKTNSFTFLKPGTLRLQEGPGPTPWTRRETVQYFQSTDYTNDGILESRSEGDVNGIPTIQETYITGAGEVISFPSTIQVVEPGTVEVKLKEFSIETNFTAIFVQAFIDPGGAQTFEIENTQGETSDDIGQIPYIELKGATRSRKTATVERFITSTPDATEPTAYDYKDYGVSVLEVTYSRSANSVNSSVNSRFIPQVKAIGSGGTGTVDSRVKLSRNAYTRREITLTQKGTDPSTSGVYEVRNEPLFISEDGTQYYLTTKITV